jgi:chemotaxis protein histidine kinase CheA
MGAPEREMEAADLPAAESLLDSFKTISAAERRRHASVLNYWLSIRGDKEFPPLHDLDPLELSDAGPNSILLELISGGHDAEIRHLGEALRFEEKAERIIDAPSPSMLSTIAKKLPIVAISRDFLAFEDEYDGPEGPVRCSATLLPLSAGGAWVDYVYAFITVEGEVSKASAAAKDVTSDDEPQPEPDEASVSTEGPEEVEALVADPSPQIENPAEADVSVDSIEDAMEESTDRAKPGFSKLFDNLVGLTGFYGHGYKVESSEEPSGDSEQPAVEPVAEEASTVEMQPLEEELAPDALDIAPVANGSEEESISVVVEETVDDDVADASVASDEPVTADAAAPEIDQDQADAAPAVSEEFEAAAPLASEGSLQDKLADVRAKADEARQAKLRANSALYDGLSAAYDFALDAEEAPEEYLRMVEAQGLKIQLRSPMRPVVKLAFDGMCDDATIRQLEAVLAWALDNELPRGTLGNEIEAAGGIGPILNGEAKAAA